MSSYSEVAERHATSRHSVRVIAEAEGLDRKRKGQGFQPFSQQRPLSIEHRRLGVRVTLIRGERSVAEMARELGLSQIRFRQLELGLLDVPLSVLLKIKELCREDIDALISGS